MFNGGNIKEYILTKLITIPIVLISLTLHEISHGWAAYKLGDPTARSLGRLSLNPLKHLDPIGTICMFFFGFGWAKPVPINTRYFKKPRRGMALTALAGPAANIVLGFIGLLLERIFLAVFNAAPAASETVYKIEVVWLTFLFLFAEMNVGLAVFNFIPIPPLDGSRILLVFLPPKIYFGLMKYERYIMIGMLALLYFGVLDPVISGAAGLVLTGMERIISLIPFI